jgi:hemoglobin
MVQSETPLSMKGKNMQKHISFIKSLLIVTALAVSFNAFPQAEQTPSAPAADEQAAPAKEEKSLYDRLGGIFSIAAVVDHFSEAIVKNPMVGKNSKNPNLRKWHRESLSRLPGLKFMRTLWVANAAGGPQQYTPVRPGKTNLGLEEAHRDLQISPAEFDEVAAELGRTLAFFKVPKREKEEVLAAFAAHKGEVTAGYKERMAKK